MVVFQERDPAYPLTDYQSLTAESGTRAEGFPDLKALLGRSYKLESYPFESRKNVGLPVIDVEKFIAANSANYDCGTINESFSSHYSFSGFERYETKTNYTRTISSGVNLNFVIFKINSKRTYKEVFSATDIEIQNNVFGEYHIKYYGDKYEIIAPVSLRKNIIDNYRVKTFVDRLYYTTPDEIIQLYGGFVLAKFYSGGVATALYSSQYEENSHDSDITKESNMDAAMIASIKAVDNSISGKADIAVGGSISYNEQLKLIRFSLSTFGGTPLYSQFITPQTFPSNVFDISTWFNSLLDPSKQTIAELPENALMPISDFVEEDNLKAAFLSYYKNGPKAQTSYITEPYIEMRRTYRTPINESWETALVSRYGDRIVLRIASMGPAGAQKYSTQEQARVKLLFPNLRFVGVSTKSPRIVGPVDVPIIASNNDFDMDKMTKYTDPKTGKIYLLTSVLKNGKKIAYTLYDKNVINDYVFSGLVTRLPVNYKTNVETIRSQYYLIAL